MNAYLWTIRTATSVLAAVQNALQQSGLNDVTVVGHSLGDIYISDLRGMRSDLDTGAALALLESVYLPQFVSSDVTFKMIGYGLPRVCFPVWGLPYSN